MYRWSSLDPENRDIIRINETHPDYDPLHYVLLLPHGDLSWTFTFNKRDGKCVSTMEFYTYHLMVRSNFNVILRSGRLLPQCIVDQYAKVKQGRLNYVFHNQRQLRAELYQGLSDAVAAGDTDGASVGRQLSFRRHRNGQFNRDPLATTAKELVTGGGLTSPQPSPHSTRAK